MKTLGSVDYFGWHKHDKNYVEYLDQMYHSILKEDHIHASTPNAFIVMA